MSEIFVFPCSEKNHQVVDGIRRTISDFLPKIVQSWKSAENMCEARVRLLIAPDGENLLIYHEMMTEYLNSINVDDSTYEQTCNTYDRLSNGLIIGWFEKESLENLMSGVHTQVAFLSAQVASVALLIDEEVIKKHLIEAEITNSRNQPMSNLLFFSGHSRNKLINEFKFGPGGEMAVSIRGTARLAGVSEKVLRTAFQDAEQNPSELSQLLIDKGFDAAEQIKFSETGIPELAVTTIFLYYAYKWQQKPSKLVQFPIDKGLDGAE